MLKERFSHPLLRNRSLSSFVWLNFPKIQLTKAGEIHPEGNPLSNWHGLHEALFLNAADGTMMGMTVTGEGGRRSSHETSLLDSSGADGMGKEERDGRVRRTWRRRGRRGTLSRREGSGRGSGGGPRWMTTWTSSCKDTSCIINTTNLVR
jgi:hypothetical protein